MDRYELPETQERRLLRSVVGELGRAFGHGYYVECAEARTFPEDLWGALASAGMTGVNIGAEWGGGDAGLAELAVVAEELAAAGCPLMTLVVSNGVCVPILQAHGTEEQKGRYLSTLAGGAARMAFAVTEAEAGTNTHEVATRAARRDGQWVVRGEKQYISGLDDSEHVMVVVRTSDEDSDALSLMVIPTRRAGVSFSPIRTHVIAAERQSVLTLDDVYVDDVEVVGLVGKGLRSVFDGLNPERVVSAAICVGIARYALDKAVGYASTRSVWGKPIGTHQAVAHPLARGYAELHAARLALYAAADAHDCGASTGTSASIAKLLAAQAVDHVLDAAIQVHGGNGLSAEYGLADLWGLARLYRIAPVSDEMTLNHLATHALGLPRSY